MIRAKGQLGFTLMELLTVLTITAVLMAVLFPCLHGARKAARSLACRSHIRSTGLAFLAYGESYDGLLPPAYTYIGDVLGAQPEEPVNGIRHWSGLFLSDRLTTEDALHCPEIPHGGLSPQNTSASNLDVGQASCREGVIDDQAQRCGFTVNEALCPRNRFKTGYQGAQRPSRLVRLSRVNHPIGTVLLTEWPQDWRIVSGPGSVFSNSHMPVHGFRGLGQMAGPDRYDLNMTRPDTVRPCETIGNYRRVNATDLSSVPAVSRPYPPRLDWVGRNHQGTGNNKNLKASSFLYLDGHAESKSVYLTIEETGFEWGDTIYSLVGSNSIN
jgi:prepilin-type N-terminal cleavage/methylation domain-containing protein